MTVINEVICVVGCDSVGSWVDSDRGTCCLHLLRGRNYFMKLPCSVVCTTAKDTEERNDKS
jgi:hypothetical protein